MSLKDTYVGRQRTRICDLKTAWDPNRIYRQLVILVNFKDMKFSMDDPQAYYDGLFNKDGFDLGISTGCVAEYFRDQSAGQFNLQFDVIGPVESSYAAEYKEDNYGDHVCKEAIKKVADSLDIDFSQYDWDGDKVVDQIVYVVAGYAANGGKSEYSKYIWPNTGSFGIVRLSDDYTVHTQSVSCEKWYFGWLSSIGTICHEFSHCLGIPDYYPTSSTATTFSVVDEWNLMDGGNYTGWGTCPPNYSASDKYQLGWLEPEEITGPMQVRDLKPVGEGGKAYVIKADYNEYYFLENRRRGRWDAALPGEGLLITYTNYSSAYWTANQVNVSKPYRYCHVTDDERSYEEWDDYLDLLGRDRYVDQANWLYNLIFSTHAYPTVINDTVYDSCTLLPYPITNIQRDADGLISFDVLASDISVVEQTQPGADDAWYDLQGRRLSGTPTRKGIYIHRNKKVIK